jgi:hypothetical protein
MEAKSFCGKKNCVIDIKGTPSYQPTLRHVFPQ